MVIAGQAAAQGDTLIYRGDKSLRWVIHDNVLELYENEVFHITIYFDTPVVPGAFVDYDDNEIFTLALATHRKVYSAKLVISSLSSDFEAVLRSIASAAHSTPDEVFVRSAYLPESSDQGSLFALTSAGSAYVSKVEFFCYSMEASNSSGNSLTLEKLAAPTITNGSGSGATSFIKGLFWGRPAEEHRGDKALGICPLEASQSTAYFATVHEDLMLRVWAANSKAPLASFPLDGTAHYSADSCNVRLCTLRKVYSNQNESNGYVYHQLVVGVLLESRDGSSTVLKVFVPQIIAGSKSYTITKPFTYEKLFSRTVRRVLGGEDSDGDETETPSQVVINCIRGNDDSRLLLYLYYRFKGHHFELVTMANSDDNSTEYIQQQHQQPQNIVVDNDSAPICGITLNKSWNTVMCTTESSTDVVRLSTAQEALPRNHINNGSVVKELTSDIDKLFAFDGHKKDINAVATAVSDKVKAFVKSGHLSATAAADEDAIIAEINEAVKATPKTEWEKSGDVEMEKEGEKEGEKAKTGRLFNVYVSSLLVQLYESQYQTCRALLIRFNALDDKANKRTENKELISTMIQLKLFVHILSTKNSKGKYHLTSYSTLL